METKRKILVVDDQEDLRVQVARILQARPARAEANTLIEQIRSRITKQKEAPTERSPGLDYEVDTVGQGRDAYDMVKESFAQHQPYALMFLDMRMPPGWDGLETAQRIRGIDKEIQIVIMTAYADYDQAELAERIGEPDKLLYIKKPFHPEEIRQLALAMTEKWSMNRREKEQLILTNRLMRENSTLTRQVFRSLDKTYRSVLNSFLSFLEARAGALLVRRQGKLEVGAATSPDDGERLRKKAESEERKPGATVLDEATGTSVFPLTGDRFDGLIYLEGKNIVFTYEKLRPFLDILVETTREVLMNAHLLHEQAQVRHGPVLVRAANLVLAQAEAGAATLKDGAGRLRGELGADERQRCCAQLDAVGQGVVAISRDLAAFCAGLIGDLSLTEENLKALTQRATEALQGELHAAHVTVEVEVEPSLSLMADARQLGDALRQLLLQAAALPPAKGGAARAPAAPRALRWTAVAADGGARLVLTLEEPGPGAAEPGAVTLFEPFRSGSDAGRASFAAAMAWQVIERHGGTLKSRGAGGQGPWFVVTLPKRPKTG